MWQYPFIFWISIMPLVVFNGSFEAAKIQVCLTGGIFLLLFWISNVLPKTKDLFTKSDVIFVAWLGILTLSSIFGVHLLESIIGGSYRYQGVIFFLTLWLIGKTIYLIKERRILLYRSIILVGIIESLVLIAQRVLFPDKVFGTFGNGKAAGGFIAMTMFLPLVVQPTFSKIIIYLVDGIGVIASSSFSAVLTALLTIKSKRILFALLVVFVLCFVATGQSARFNNLYEGRGITWKLAITSIGKSPVLGYGAESGEVVFDEAFRVYGTRLEGLTVERAHNIFLDVAMWSGIPGLIVFVYWIITRLKEAEESWRKRAIVGWIVFAFFQPLGAAHWLMLMVFLF